VKGVAIGMIFTIVMVGFVSSILIQIVKDVLFPSSNMMINSAEVLRLRNQNTLTQLALYGGDDSEEVKEEAGKLLSLSLKSPQEVAVSPATAEITDATFTKIDNALKSDEKVDKNILNSISSKCQAWLMINNPGAQDFEFTEDMLGAFYTGLMGESTGGFKLLNPATVAQTVNENLEALEPLFVSGGLNTINCAECWTLREEYLDAVETSPEGEAVAIEGQIRNKACAESCASVCENIYPAMKILSLAQNMLAAEEDGESLEKALILTEITLD
jgi:hypothetical protein